MTSSKQKWRVSVVGLTLVVFAALVSACSSDDNSDGAILRYGVDLTPMGGAQFDPINDSKSLVPNRNSWNDLIYDRLIYRADDGTLEPGLLESWDTVDELTLEVTVREGVEFQDGTPLDAEALKFNWDRDLEAEELSKPLDFQRVESVEVVSERVVRINYSTPAIAFTLNNTFVLSRGVGAIASPTAIKEKGEAFNKDPVGAGPYGFDSYDAGQKLSLRSWDGYWNPEAQKLDGVDFVQTARGAATISALQTGKIDLARIAESDIAAVENNDGLTTLSKPGTEVLYFYLNLERAPFDSVEARRALAYAFDRDEINQGAYAGNGVVTDTLYYPESPFYSPDVEIPWSHSAEEAAERLRAAGVPEGTTIEVLVQNIPEMESGAEVLQAQLKAVGIEAKLKVSPNFVDEMAKKPDSLFASTINANIPGSFLSSGATYNLGFNSPAFEKATAATLGAADDEELANAYRVSQQELVDEVPIYFMAQEPVTLGMSDKVDGVGAVRSDLEGAILADVSLK